MERRLAAVLVADVVGYSRLMEADEAGTLHALKARREGVLEPVIKARGGRIVKLMGDGVLAEFGSAVNAVQSAIDLQQRMAERPLRVYKIQQGETLSPAGPKLPDKPSIAVLPFQNFSDDANQDASGYGLCLWGNGNEPVAQHHLFRAHRIWRAAGGKSSHFTKVCSPKSAGSKYVQAGCRCLGRIPKAVDHAPLDEKRITRAQCDFLSPNREE